MTIKITKGLDLSLEGEVNHQVLPEVKNLTSRVAVLGKDFHGIRPTMLVSEGCLLYTSPSPRDIPLSRMPSSA